MTLVDALIASSILAVTSPQECADTTLEQAARIGELAAQHGACIPLFALLDICHGAGLEVQTHYRYEQEEALQYVAWLKSFGRLLTARRLVNRSSPECIALLCTEWPGRPASSWGEQYLWTAAYRQLQHPTMLARIRQAWQAQSSQSIDWTAWWHAGTAAPPLARAIWASFAISQPEALVHEQFDHAAAHYYLTAKDPPSARALVKQLRSRPKRPADRGRSQPDAYERQRMHVGAITLATLAEGAYGEFKIVNNRDIRLAANPRSHPPPLVDLHLCWGCDFQALTRSRPWKTGRLQNIAGIVPRDVQNQRITHASILKALVALVVDDWRHALAEIDIQLHVHRFWKSRQNSLSQAKPPPWPGALNLITGRRYKAIVSQDHSQTPPAHFVGHLFRRLDHVDLAWQKLSSFPVMSQPHGRPGLWVTIVLEHDLRKLGFKLTAQQGWTCQRANEVAAWPPLPRSSRYLCALDPQRHTGKIMAVIWSERTCSLRYLQRPAGSLNFVTLRHVLQNTVLRALFPF